MTDTTNITPAEENLDPNAGLPVVDELASLKSRAETLGITFHPNIGLEKLREKVNAVINGTAQASEVSTKAAGPTIDLAKTQADTEEAAEAEEQAEQPAVREETLLERRARKRREANKLVRIRLVCMNPAKKEWEGEVFTSGNSLVGSFTKFVPFNTDEGWHVPGIIYNMIKDRQCQIFVAGPKGVGRVGKMIKEFAVEILPDLTPEELHELAQRQAMAGSVG